MKLADYAVGRPGAQALQAAGFHGAVRYMCDSPDRGLVTKKLLPEEAADFKSHGLELVSNHQRGKHHTAEWRGGFEAGVREATYADQYHRECGGPPDRPIYFSCDEDIDADTWNAFFLPYLQGCASVIGKDRVGVYGGQRTMWWAQEDGWERWLWQTCGWSRYEESPLSRSQGGIWRGTTIPVQWVTGTRIRQERIDKNGEVVNGITVDVNSTWADDYGQWSKSTAAQNGGGTMTLRDDIEKKRGKWVGDPTWLPDVFRLWGLRLDVIGDPEPIEYGHGDFNEVVGVIGHHTAGGGVNDWRIVKWGRPGLAGPLAQLVLEKNGSYKLIALGVCWHAGNGEGSKWAGKFTTDANWRTIGIEAVSRGTEVNGRYDWTDIQLESYKRGVAAILWFLRKDASWFCGHREYNFIDGKIDPAGINLDSFRADVQALIDQGPDGTGTDTGPIPDNKTAIEAKRDENEWLGAKVMPERELPTPDGVGRFAHYEHGSIYWKPMLGAVTVPKGGIYEFWASVMWETGFLGYPVRDANTVPEGKIQQFEHGDVCIKNGDEKAWPVIGGIRNTWTASGGVVGKYGWPQSREYSLGVDIVGQDFTGGRIAWRMKDGPIGIVTKGEPDDIGGSA